MFTHSLHDYSDYSYYFVTSNDSIGKTVELQYSETSVTTHYVNKFDDYLYHEEEIYNLLKTGREWYGELFDSITSYDFEFVFPNISPTDSVKLKVELLFRSSNDISLTFCANDSCYPQIDTSGGPYDTYSDYGETLENEYSFFSTTDSNIIHILFEKDSTYGKAWLNYIILNARRNMKMTGQQMPFRDMNSVGTGNVAEFKLTDVSSHTKIWNVTEPTNVKQLQTTLIGDTLSFKAKSDSLCEYIAFDTLMFLTPTILGDVANQNLHGLTPKDMIIVTHPEFVFYAEQLAQHHRNYDSLSVDVVTTEQIYNEFSSGAPDVSSIRDFLRMLYIKANNEKPKYLFLSLKNKSML